MKPSDLIALLPHLAIAMGVLAVTLMVTVRRSHAAAAILTSISLLAAALLAPLVAVDGARRVTGLLIVDGYSEFFISLMSLAGAALTLLAYDYWRTRSDMPEEYYILLLLATLGSSVLVSSIHFASTFLGLETLSVALYGMIAYRREEPLSVEAGLKYLILAGASSAFLLFGMALVYSQVGSMQFSAIRTPSGGPAAIALVVDVGLALMLVGIGFKLALVPFHFWTPDVYQGASAPAAGFIATVSKGAMFALLVRLFGQPPFTSGSLTSLLTALAIASMFAGNLLALRQRRLKRILAYSSIAHMGYLLIALLAGPPLAVDTVAFYLVAYFLSMIGAFGTVGVWSRQQKDADSLRDFQGLAWQRPGLAAVMSGTIFSLAGIPLTAGFLAKFQVMAAGIDGNLWWLVMLLAINSAIGLYYYLRIIVVLYQPPRKAVRDDARAKTLSGAMVPMSFASATVLSALSLLLVWLGVYPGPLLNLLRTVAIGGG